MQRDIICIFIMIFFLLPNINIDVFAYPCVCVCVPSTEQMDEGLAGRQRQFEGWIHNLSKELNHYKAANLELSNKLRELSGPASQAKEHVKGKCNIGLLKYLLLLMFIVMIIVVFTAYSKMA